VGLGIIWPEIKTAMGFEAVYAVKYKPEWPEGTKGRNSLS